MKFTRCRTSANGSAAEWESPYAFTAISAAASKTPTAAGGAGRIIASPTATVTSTPQPNGRCKWKASAHKVRQHRRQHPRDERPKQAQEARLRGSVERSVRASVPPRRARDARSRATGAGAVDAEARVARHRRRWPGRSPSTATITASTTATIAAGRNQLTAGSHGCGDEEDHEDPDHVVNALEHDGADYLDGLRATAPVQHDARARLRRSEPEGCCCRGSRPSSRWRPRPAAGVARAQTASASATHGRTSTARARAARAAATGSRSCAKRARPARGGYR